MKSKSLSIGSALVLFSGLLLAGCGKKPETAAPEKNQNASTEGGQKPAEEGKPAPAVEPSREITSLGVKLAMNRDIEWTAYFITPVKRSKDGKGKTVTFTGLDGQRKTIQLTGTSYIEAEMEAVAVGVDKEGRKRFAYRIGAGVWKELPEGSMGMGNRLNPLVPFRHVAADNSLYPYGSMVHVPVAVGVKFGNAQAMDGYFWVADSGGRIKGNHIDLFVGDQEVYEDFVDRHHAKHHPTVISKLPAAAKGLDPRKPEQLAKLLVAAGKLPEANVGDKTAVNEALIGYQKTVAYIPVSEYGNPTAATTIWFLTQLGLGLNTEKDKVAAK